MIGKKQKIWWNYIKKKKQLQKPFIKITIKKPEPHPINLSTPLFFLSFSFCLHGENTWRRMIRVCAEGERRWHWAGMPGSSKLDGDGTLHDGSSSAISGKTTHLKVTIVVSLSLRIGGCFPQTQTQGGIVNKFNFFLTNAKNNLTHCEVC